MKKKHPIVAYILLILSLVSLVFAIFYIVRSSSYKDHFKYVYPDKIKEVQLATGKYELYFKTRKTHLYFNNTEYSEGIFNVNITNKNHQNKVNVSLLDLPNPLSNEGSKIGSFIISKEDKYNIQITTNKQIDKTARYYITKPYESMIAKNVFLAIAGFIAFFLFLVIGATVYFIRSK